MRTPRRLLSGSTLGALIAVGALADPAAADSSEPHPVPASATEVPLTLAPDADPVPEHESVDAPHRSIRDDAAPFSLDAPDVVLTATSETSGFAVAGVVWDDTGDADVSSVELRTLSDGTWSPWESVEPEESEKDVPSSADASLAGTDPIVIGDVDQVEVRLVADAEPSNARLAVIDPGTSAADSAVPEASEAGDFPPILPRSAWGADESIMTWTPQPATVSGAVIHHTAGTNDYTPEQVPAILRGIYTFHAQTNDWGDIGYNFLIDKFGRAWEGRAGGITNATVGAHAYGFNSVTTGISVMGNYTTAAISDPAWDTLVDVTAWKLSERGVDVNGTMVVNGTTYPALVGHRDVGVTECPGDQLYERLGELRDAVSERQAHYDATPEVAPEPETSPEPQPETTPEPEPSPEPTPDVTPEPEPSPEASPAPGVTPGPEVTPEPEVAPEPDGDGDPVVEGPVVDGPDVEGPSVEPGLDGPGADGPGTDGDRDVPPPAGDGSLGGVTPISSVDRAPDTARGPRPPGQLAATGTVVATSVGLMVLALGSGVALLHRARASVD